MDEQSNASRSVTPSLPRLYGRSALEARIAGEITSGGHRLITLLGPGGVGKTSLARALAIRLEPAYERLAPFVELAAVGDAELIVPVIAGTLGIVSTQGDGLTAAVVAALDAEPGLLILDNLEQLSGADRVVRWLLEAAQNLTILTTSRTPLGVPGELEIAVEPLAVPEPGDAELSTEALRSYAAIELFEACARRVMPEFELTVSNGRNIADIVRRLDGIPLGIELVTSRARSLSTADMSAHLDELLPLPASSDRPTPARQRTVLASIAWSAALLPESTQTALMRLAVFPGSFDLDAARAVADAGLSDIDSLLSHNLFRLVDRTAEPRRFGMLETVRQFGLERLRASGEETAIRERHLAWAIACGRALIEGRFGPELPELQQRHRYLLSDVFPALAWAIEHDRIESALALYIQLNPYQFNFPWEVGVLWWTRIAPLLDRPALDAGLVAAAWTEAARTLYAVGRLNESDQAFARACEIARDNGETDLLALALAGRGATMRGLARDGNPAELTSELRALSEVVASPFVRHSVFIELGAQSMINGELDAADVHFNEALSLARSARAAGHQANALHFLGYVAALKGDLGRARDAFHRSIHLYEHGPETQRLSSLHGLGRVELMSNRPAAAYEALAESLAGRRRRGETLQVRFLLTDMALLALATGRPRLAGEWFGAAELNPALLSARRFFADRWTQAIEETRNQLGEEEFDRALARGRLAGLDESVSQALAMVPTGAIDIDQERAELTQLSPRELEVLRLIVNGASDRQIAGALFISPLTATRHVKNILHKLNVPTRTAAATLAVRRGAIRTD